MSRAALPAAVLSLFCIQASAQFDALETTDDGSVLMFQSAWLQSGTPDDATSRIFRWDSTGFSQVSQPVASQALHPPYYASAFLSGDGKIFGYTFFPGCSDTGCASVSPSLHLTGATIPANLPAITGGTLSRNGRYLATGNTVIDLTNGTTTNISTGPGTGGHYGISNKGGVLVLIVHVQFIVSTTDLTLSSKPGVTIVTAPKVLDAVLSPAENRVVYEIWGDTSATRDQLWSYDVSSGQSVKLADIPLGTSVGISQFQPSISNDGSRLLYQRPRTGGGFEVVLFDYNTGATTVVSQILPSFSNFVITGDGTSAWVHRTDGKLVKISLDTMQATETPGRHAWMAQQEGGPVPGSYHHLYGGGFAPDDTSGPSSDITVGLPGELFPVLAANTGELDVQIPWIGPDPGEYPLTLQSASSPFISVLPLDVEVFAPTFERTGMPNDSQRSIIVAHQDFHGLVTQADPAIPGEIVTAYMTGLGETQPEPPSGSPPTSLADVSHRPVCGIGLPNQSPEPAPMMFAGLAPGLVGLYQVNISIPQDLSIGSYFLSCWVGVPGFGVTGDLDFLPVGNARPK